MLREECRRFQSRYERGSDDPHLDSCATCREFVAFVDGLRRLGASAPLGDQLRNRLRRLPHEHDGVSPFPNVPQLPLPSTLAERLRKIARRTARETLPIWIRSPRYALAASYLLTLLIGATVGNPAAWAGEAEQRLDRFGTVILSARATGHETWAGIEETALEGLGWTRNFLRSSRSSLRARWIETFESLNEQEDNDESSAQEGAGSSS